MTLGPLLALCARHELLLAVRSRWLQTFAVVFGVLTLLVASSGYVLSGGSGVQDFARTAESMVQLILLLVPLAALIFGALALSPERGAAELLYSQPVPRGTVLLGRVAGLFLALTGAQAIGFGVAGFVVQRQAGSAGATAFLGAVALAFVLTAVFVAIAALVSQVQAAKRTRALAAALVVWFVAVLAYDVAVLGIASLLRSGTASRLLIVATLVNPVDAARTGALMAVEGTAAFGAASLALLRFTGGALGAGVLIATSLAAWTIVPLALAARRLSRADI
ncbi:MAG: ABC transporter permease subunit [Acidobacteriota bacterium]